MSIRMVPDYHPAKHLTSEILEQRADPDQSTNKQLDKPIIPFGLIQPTRYRGRWHVYDLVDPCKIMVTRCDGADTDPLTRRDLLYLAAELTELAWKPQEGKGEQK